MSVTAARGFVAAGISAGIKTSGRPDLALVATEDGRPVPTAGVFTPNRMTAAPVVVSQEHLSHTDGRAAAVILNSGGANAAMGARGLADAERMCAATAEAIGADRREVLVCSTGLIGIPLPIDTIVDAVPALAEARHPDGGGEAAEAIRTTDTRAKQAAVHGDGFTVGGMVKGAGMIAPALATMLAVITTDAQVEPGELASLLADAAEDSFNTIRTDGCMSTNDTVLVLASGVAGPVDRVALAGALTAVCRDLAYQIIDDGEGATKVVTVRVRGASSREEAERGARQIADSMLVKCSWYGQKPYWGRIASELGAAGITLEPDSLSIAYGDHVVCERGIAAEHDTAGLTDYMAQREITVTADLGLGIGSATVLTNDLSHAYVDENMGDS